MYLMGREARYPEALTAELEANLLLLLEPVNDFVTAAAAEGVPIGIDEHTQTIVASGWRPPAVNDRTQNAATESTHLSCLGIDLQDILPRRSLARFALRCARPGGLLERLGLYLERPQWTPDWVHLQHARAALRPARLRALEQGAARGRVARGGRVRAVT